MLVNDQLTEAGIVFSWFLHFCLVATLQPLRPLGNSFKL